MNQEAIAFENTNLISKPIFSRQTFWDAVLLVVLFLLSFVVVYELSHKLSKLFFLGLLILFLFSKKDYFWFAYFFILTMGPGYFFADFSGLSTHRLPFYTFLPSMSFYPQDLFIILAFVKALVKGRRVKLKLQGPLIFILFYLICSSIISSFLFETTTNSLASHLRWVSYYSIIFSFSYLITKKNEIYRFIFLVSSFVFFILFTQIYLLLTGNEFINLFSVGFRRIYRVTFTGEIRPFIGGVLLLFFSFILALVQLRNKEYKFSKMYLYLIIGIPFLVIFLSATRVWFAIFSFILIGYVLISRKNMMSILKTAVVLFVLIAILSHFGLIKSDILRSSWNRSSKVFDLMRGSFQSVPTFQKRIGEIPFMLGVIKGSPFIGYGFSDITNAFYNNDLGFFNTILMFGFTGFALFIYFFIRYFKMIRTSIRRISDNNPFKTPLKIMALAFGGILIGYFSTWDFFTFYFQKVFFISVFIATTELFIRQADEKEKFIKENKISTNTVEQ